MNNLVIAIVLLLPMSAAAQPVKGDWQRVQSLAEGSQVRVTARDGARLRGTIVSVSSDSLTMIVKGQSRSLPFVDVSSVQMRSRKHRILLGAILVSVGVAAGWLICPYCSNEGHGNDLMLLGAGAGAAGWLGPIYVTIYEARLT